MHTLTYLVAVQAARGVHRGTAQSPTRVLPLATLHFRLGAPAQPHATLPVASQVGQRELFEQLVVELPGHAALPRGIQQLAVSVVVAHELVVCLECV
jgi:hypothetical protein